MSNTENIQVLNHVINKCPIEILNYKYDYVGIQYSKANGYYYIGEDIYITYDGGCTGKSLKQIRLIVLPLSYLTKEIEVNREKFVPIDKIAIRLFDMDVQFIILNGETNGFPFWVIEKLYEWHFDIHGLIEKGLAIDKTR